MEISHIYNKGTAKFFYVDNVDLYVNFEHIAVPSLISYNCSLLSEQHKYEEVPV